VRLDTTGSTNDDAWRLLSEGLEPPFAVIAREQTHGRGRGENAWSSPPGGVWLSAALACDAPAGVVSLASALAAAHAIERDAPARVSVSIKWPNDLFLGGRKIGGVLGERRFARPDARTPTLVVGVGINADNDARTIAHLPGAATIRDSIGRSVDPERLARALGAALVERLTRLDGLDALPDPVRREIDARLARRGSEVEFTRAGGPSVAGRLLGVDRDGAALIDAGGRVRRVLLGELRGAPEHG